MQKRAVWVGVACVLVVAGLAAVFLLRNNSTWHGGVIDPPMQAAEINLTDFNGHDFALSGQRGKIAILYFGYTNCPDECPLTMAHLKLAKDQLGDKSSDVKVVMISTDPQRDTPQAMKDFLSNFGPDFAGLVGTPEALASVWRDYGVTVEDGGETHSNYIYVIDRAGNFRETFLPDSDPAEIAADLRRLLREN